MPLKTKHAGVIPYTIKNGNILFLLGIDSRSKDLADFGGKNEPNEDSYQTAFREFKEETLKIFSNKVYDYMSSDFETVTDYESNTIIFLPVESKWINRVITRFNEKKKLKSSKFIFEMCGLKWVNEFDFLKKLNQQPNFDQRYRSFHYRSNNPLWETLRKLLVNVCNNNFFNRLEHLYDNLLTKSFESFPNSFEKHSFNSFEKESFNSFEKESLNFFEKDFPNSFEKESFNCFERRFEKNNKLDFKILER